MDIFRIRFFKVVHSGPTTIRLYFPLVTTSSFHFREISKKCAVKPLYSLFYCFLSLEVSWDFCFFIYISLPMLHLTHSCKIAMVGEFFCLLKFAHMGPFM